MTKVFPRENIEVCSTVPDFRDLAHRLRYDDKQELWATGRETPLDALLRAWAWSPLYKRSVFFKGSPIAVFGVAAISMIGRTGAPWFVGTPEVDRLPLSLLRIGRQAVVEMLMRYDVLWNMIDSRHYGSVSFVQKLGFTVEDAVPFGPDGVPCHPFRLERAWLGEGDNLEEENVRSRGFSGVYRRLISDLSRVSAGGGQCESADQRVERSPS